MSQLNVNILNNSADSGTDVDVTQLGQSQVLAWVNFNGTGTVEIRDDFGVSSITDDAVGKYTVNFSPVIPNENYAWQCNGRGDSSYMLGVHGAWNTTPTTSALSIWSGAYNQVEDITYCCVAIFG